MSGGALVRNPFGIPPGVPIPGGCLDCHAYQVMRDEPDAWGIWRLEIRHDDTCPTLARKRGRR